MSDHYTYRITWSPEDNANVSQICTQPEKKYRNQ